MTEPKSPADRLLELVVYGPVGLAATVVEEFPHLVEKGRHQIEGQVRTARVMGQFALQLGRRRMEQSIDRLGAQATGRSARAAPRSPSARPAPSPSSAPSAGASTTHAAPAPTPASPDVVPSPSAADAGVVPPPGPSAVRAAPTPAGAGAASAANGGAAAPNLAIPGYDSLSASQVVQRLEGLSAAELEDVRDHEAAHRQRRTILHRVDQLLSGPPGGQP